MFYLEIEMFLRRKIFHHAPPIFRISSYFVLLDVVSKQNSVASLQ